MHTMALCAKYPYVSCVLLCIGGRKHASFNCSYRNREHPEPCARLFLAYKSKVIHERVREKGYREIVTANTALV